MMRISSKDFALAVVASSSPDLSIQDKIKLYEEAVLAVQEHNKPLVEAERKKSAESSKVLAEALGRGESIF